MKKQVISRINFFTDRNNNLAVKWEKRIKKWLKENYPVIKVTQNNYQVAIALGGDGTIMKAAKSCSQFDSILIGLNLGKVGFLASVRESKNFLKSLEKVLETDFLTSRRIMLDYNVIRNNRVIFESNSLNEVIILNPLGIVELDVSIEKHHLQKIKGTGALVSTPTGSTAFNLSAHGPVVMPDVEGLILMELFDHNIPTPAIILNKNQTISFKIISFRKKYLLNREKTKEAADVMLIADGDLIFTLEEGDVIKIKKSLHEIKFAELEKNHFLKSLKEKFDFK